MTGPRTANFHHLICSTIICLLLAIPARSEEENFKTNGKFLPSGQRLTPLAAPGAQLSNLEVRRFPPFIASGAMSTAVSPDRKTLLVLTARYAIAAHSPEYIFVYDISASKPFKRQIIRIPNSFVGIAFSPNGKTFYVGGGRDDNVHIYSLQRNGSWRETEKPIPLCHHHGGNGLDLHEKTPVRTGGLAVTSDGSKLVIANVYNDSISVVDLATRSPDSIDLRPGKIDPNRADFAGGEYPFGVVIKGNDTA